MPKSSASETGSAGYVRTPWDEEESLVDFAKSAYEAAASDTQRGLPEISSDEAGSPDLSNELEGALENQLRALDRSFATPQRQRRSAFHELAMPPQRERPALPALPPPPRTEVSLPSDDPWADEDERELWAAEPSAAADDYGWPDRDPDPIALHSPDDVGQAGYDDGGHEDEDRRAEAYWASAWQRPAEAAPSTGRPRITLAPSMLVVAGLAAMVGGAGVAVGVQRMKAPDLTPIAEANATVMAASAVQRPAPSTDVVNPPQQATKLSYDRVESVTPPVRASAAEGEPDRVPQSRASAGPVSRSEAAALSDAGLLEPASREATRLASVTAEVEPADDEDQADMPAAAAEKPATAAGTPPAPRPSPKQTARTNAFVNMRTKADGDSATVMVVPANVTVDLYGCNGWCEVGYGGKRGFVYKSFLGEKPKAKPRATATASRSTAQPAAASTAAATTAPTTAAAAATNNATAANTNSAAASTTASANTTSPTKRWLDGLGFYR